MRRTRAANPYQYGEMHVRKFLACIPHARPQNSAGPSLRAQFVDPDERSDVQDHSNTAPDIAALIRAEACVHPHAKP